MQILLLLVAGYLVGSLSFAVIVSRLMGLPDPHTYGSGNPGATNVLRSGSKKAAILTLLGDALKGLAVVLFASAWGKDSGSQEWVPALAGLAAFIGHLFPVYFGFKGGKGVATAAGVLFGVSAWTGLSVLAVWGITFAATRISSVGALAAAAAAPVATWIFGRSPAITACTLVMAVLLIWRHRENIKRLRSGNERKIGSR